MGDAAGGSPPGGGSSNRRGWRPPDDLTPDGPSGASAPEPTSGNERRPAPPSPPPVIASSLQTTLPGSVTGQASAVAATSVQSPNGIQTTVVTFRLEQYDARAGRTGVTTVRLTGEHALGFVTEGDWVEVLGKSKHGFIEASKAVNHTSRAQYSRSGEGCSKAALYVAYALFGIVFLAIAGFIAFSILGEVFTG
jgi:hypothetical protein